ncbi:MAG: STAS domain-containing protein [Nocardioides sp.]
MSLVPLGLDFDAASRVLAVTGDVDEAQAADLRVAIDEHSGGCTTDLVVDLSAVTYLPSAAVGVLARASQRFETVGTTFELAVAAGSVAQRVLQVCAMPHRSY